MDKMYLCIDLKSFYASVECVKRGLDPFKTLLVVADPSRGSGGICLAASPAIKAMGVPNRCRLFEIPAGLKYIIAKPRMKLYMEISAEIYDIYLRYIDSEDIHIYSIDECFIDVTPYLKAYHKTAREMAVMLTDAVYRETGICAAAGVGTNLFLAKVALDITAKHSPDHIGCLDEEEFCRTIWHHTPLTDIWNIGRGTAKRLKQMGAVDLCDVAHMDEKQLFREFGVNARYLIDHAHGTEPCTIADIHNYKSKSRSLSSSQILFENYAYEDALTVIKEMADALVTEMSESGLCAGSVSLGIGYADDSIPSTGGTKKLNGPASSLSAIMPAFEELCSDSYGAACAGSQRVNGKFFDRSALPLIRRLSVGLGELEAAGAVQQDLFSDHDKEIKEQNLRRSISLIRERYGKNALIKGISLTEKATAIERNALIGGHNAE
ncbi:MAG: DNA repair protein [Oscillospiraceae bacterium]|nr:DNA repair protein [Oscillospiraceae bacterium]